ncbi:zinc-ribbon domain-containing protein [Variovorax sp. RHLX14]|uniref:zinc ribbon domain-containing protein n=1 Tax=Variovorax sp. RHLX14 TaxID=1259731 RepID=UPI003F4515C1
MSRVNATTAICPECGTANPESARFCTNCAARLGAEPSIVAPRLSAPSRLAASGAIPSRPAPLPAAHANTAAFWVKLGIGGLILLIGFIGWSVYVLTDVKVVTQLPTGQGGDPAAAAAASASVSAPAETSLRPLTPSTQATGATGATGTTGTTGTTALPAIPAQPAAVPASAQTTAVPTNPEQRSRDDDDLQRRIEALEKQLAGQRSRAANRASAARAAEEPAAGSSAATATGGWVAPSRAPAMTSSPGYRDSGPPVVRGPEPTVPMEVVRPTPSVATPAPDLGPPVVEGPGPRYDFSRQGGANR